MTDEQAPRQRRDWLGIGRPMMKYNDMSSAGYVCNDMIGKGTFGVVHACTRVRDGRVLAMKMVEVLFNELDYRVLLRREVEVLDAVVDRNVVRMVDVFCLDNVRLRNDGGMKVKCAVLCIVTEMADMELDKYIKRVRETFEGQIYKDFMRAECVRMLRDVLSGLAALEEKGIIHRDVKPDNVVVAKNEDGSNTFRAMLADMGSARYLPGASNRTGTSDGSVVADETLMRVTYGSMAYRAPELLLGAMTYDSKIDSWGCGLMFAEMLAGAHISRAATDPLSEMMYITTKLGPLDDEEYDEFCDIYGVPISMLDALVTHKLYTDSIQYTQANRDTLYNRLAEQYDAHVATAISGMLIYSPSNRLSVSDALSHVLQSPLLDVEFNEPRDVPRHMSIPSTRDYLQFKVDNERSIAERRRQEREQYVQQQRQRRSSYELQMMADGLIQRLRTHISNLNPNPNPNPNPPIIHNITDSSDSSEEEEENLVK